MMRRRGLRRRARTISMRWRSPTERVETMRRGIELEVIGLEHPEELGEQLALGELRIEAKRDVLQHRHRLEQREMLEDHADAEPAGGARIGDAGRRAVEDDLSLVRREDAIDHLDERRFARAVLAEKRVDFAGPDAQVDIVVGAYARERLADADELQSQGSIGFHLDIPSIPWLPPERTAGRAHARTAPIRLLRGDARRKRFPPSPRRRPLISLDWSLTWRGPVSN